MTVCHGCEYPPLCLQLDRCAFRESHEPGEPTRREMVESYQAPDLDDVIPARHLRRRMLQRLDESSEVDV